MPDPNVPDAFAVIADRVGGNGLYSSNAQVMVYKLVGDFDPKEAISHGFIDSQQLPAWRATDGSLADFGGMPSSVIEGTYRENNMTLNTSRRHVIATAGPDKYLVSLSVTTSVDQVVAAADATDAIVNGFKVSSPVTTPAPRLRRPACPSPLASWGPRRTPQLWDSRDRRRPPGEAWRPGDGPIRRAVSGARMVWRMLIAAVLCLCAAAATAALGVWLLTRPVAGDLVRQVLRARRTDPTRRRGHACRRRSGGAVGSAPDRLVGSDRVRRRRDRTVAAGCWQSAKFVAARAGGTIGCGGATAGCGRGACATCTLSSN